MSTPSPVVFVGLGAIGTPMSQRIAAAGFAVTGVDPFEAARERSAAAGIPAVASIAEAPADGDVVVMVATPDQLDELVAQATSAGVAAGRTWVVMSTVGPDAVRRAGEQLTAAGARVVDAPVTGGVARATTGELIIFASGAEQDLAATADLLRPLGTARIVGTDLGQGQAIKVVNQHLCSVHIVAAAEALALGAALGLDKADVLDLVGGGAAGSWMLSDRGPRMLQGADAEVTSTIGIFVKDSGLVADAAAGVGAEVPVLAAARERYLLAASAGLERRDDSSVIETYQH
ncbi:NAD(P)-dependent oxidoreductase [Agrococcus jenensis]|uniref:3-hydroxyisobutyrate dehydrogenase/putative dehydrogenase n=1 Tax=Agrococcus jenensis TaxID=46353 RepID=A0A3N2AS59_9MICO|nr:NAD(P)-dependent oxidoreductase [Agrococcus jenensis]ROR65748.1 3-hydroxyisobutyrate dehydrogenase/putative dehydrogenase [Agrococcus jenensis]